MPKRSWRLSKTPHLMLIAITIIVMVVMSVSSQAHAQDQETAPTDTPAAQDAATPDAKTEQDSALTPQEQRRRRDAQAAELDRKRAEALAAPIINQKPLHSSLGWRVGPTFNGMFSSYQGRPFVYPSFGWRYKPGSLYLDLHAPFIAGLFDAAQWALQDKVLGLPSSFNLFEDANGPAQYVFIEVAHLRLGQSFAMRLGQSKDNPGIPFHLNVGLAALADWVFFEARQLGRPLEDLDDVSDVISLDPYVLGLGAFVGAMITIDHVTVDLNIEVARDLFSPSNEYEEQNGWVIGADFEVIVKIIDNFGMYGRVRHSLYTHLEDLNLWGMSGGAGVILSF